MYDEHEYMWEVENRVERQRARAKAKAAKAEWLAAGNRTWWQRLFRYRIKITIVRSW